jgi:hypothetical protein
VLLGTREGVVGLDLPFDDGVKKKIKTSSIVRFANPSGWGDGMLILYIYIYLLGRKQLFGATRDDL